VLEITVVPWRWPEVTFEKNFRERKSAYGFCSLRGAVFDSFVDRYASAILILNSVASATRPDLADKVRTVR
jgi:hypothetical protein